MLKVRGKASEADVLDRVKQLPENMKVEMLDFLDFLNQKSRKSEGPQDVKKAVSAVEDTGGSIKLSREVLKFVAEDKELEYEV